MEKYDHMIMVCGSGKNVGKTSLSVLFIEFFSHRKKSVYALKTSTHMHPLEKDEQIIDSGKNHAIIKETRYNNKDSSLFLQAGATESYYIQATTAYLPEAFQTLKKLLPKGAFLICESGALRSFIQPGLFIFISGKDKSKNSAFQSFSDFELTYGIDFNHEKILNSKLPLHKFI